eukprot:COSAG03_NODE_3003_length_2294_cov_1.522096_1_plen_56_part_00
MVRRTDAHRDRVVIHTMAPEVKKNRRMHDRQASQQSIHGCDATLPSSGFLGLRDY